MFEIFRATAGGFFWRLKGVNGETLCHSEVTLPSSQRRAVSLP